MPTLADIRTEVDEQAKSAESVGDFTEIIVMLQRDDRLKEAVDADRYCREMLSWALNRRGEIYLKHSSQKLTQGDEADAKRLDGLALQDFESAVTKDPKRWKAIHNRGTMLAIAGRAKEALADFSRTIELNPDHALAWLNRAELHFDRRDYALAEKDYTQAIRIDGDLESAFLKRGQCRMRVGEYQSALADFNRVVATGAENDSAIVNTSALVERGEAHRMLGNWRAAADDFRSAIDGDPKCARAYQRTAWLMATCPEERFRNPQLALDVARKAVELSDEMDFQYHDVLAAALANQGEFAEAMEVLQQAVELAPPEALPLLKERMSLYEQKKPYRQKLEKVAKR